MTSMTSVQKFLPAKDESLLGFLRRFADEDFYPDLTTFLNALNIRYDRALLEKLGRLAGQLSINSDALEEIAPIADRNAGLRDRSYDRLQIDPVCACCLAETGIRRQAWRHSLVTACPIHKVRLLDRCQSCEEPLGLVTGGQFHCRCGTDLRLADTTEAGEFEIAVASAIEGSCVATSYFPSEWALLPPPDIARFFSILAGFALRFRTGKAGKSPKPKSIGEALQFLRLIEPPMTSWPVGFQTAVVERISLADTEHLTAVEILGNRYQALMRLSPTHYAPVREALREAITQSYPGNSVHTLQSEKTDQWISAAQAGRQLKMRAETLVEAVKNGEIEGEIRSSGLGHRHTVIRMSDIAVISACRTRFISAVSLRERLSVSKRHLHLLKESGLFSDLPKAKRPIVSQGPFDWATISDRIEEIRSRSTVPDLNEETLPLRDVNLRKTTDKTALLAFYVKIWDGSVVPIIGDAEEPLGAFRFRVSDIDRSLANRPDLRSWTAQEVAEFAGWKSECVTHWCKSGLLESAEFSHAGHSKFLINPRNLSTFQTRYIPLTHLAHQRETTSRKLLSQLPSDAVVGTKSVGKVRRCLLVDLAKLPIEQPAVRTHENGSSS